MELLYWQSTSKSLGTPEVDGFAWRLAHGLVPYCTLDVWPESLAIDHSRRVWQLIIVRPLNAPALLLLNVCIVGVQSLCSFIATGLTCVEIYVCLICQQRIIHAFMFVFMCADHWAVLPAGYAHTVQLQL